MFKKLFIIALGIVAISCTKTDFVSPNEYTYIKANAVEAADGTKTVMNNLEVLWSAPDSISLTNKTSFKNAFSRTENPIKTAEFATAAKMTEDWYAFHPYRVYSKAEKAYILTKGLLMEVPSIQHPQLTSFEGDSDILVSDTLHFGTSGSREVEAHFTRLTSVVKITFIDNTSEGTYSNDPIIKVSFRNGKYALCGDNYVNIDSCKFVLPYTDVKTEIVAEYDASDNYIINGTNSTYISALPNTISSGYTIFEFWTEGGKNWKKEVRTYKSFTDKCIKLEQNKITSFNVSVTD